MQKEKSRVIPHKGCTQDAKSDFSADCINSTAGRRKAVAQSAHGTDAVGVCPRAPQGCGANRASTVATDAVPTEQTP